MRMDHVPHVGSTVMLVLFVVLLGVVVRVVIGYGDFFAPATFLTLAELRKTTYTTDAVMNAQSALLAFCGTHALPFEVHCATSAAIRHALAFDIPMVFLAAVRFRPRFLRNTKAHVTAASDECVLGMTAELASFHDRWILLLGLDALAKNEALRSGVLFESRQAEVQLLLNARSRLGMSVPFISSH